MAEGLRVRPRPALLWPDDGMIVVVDHARPYPPPADGTPIELAQPSCAKCGQQHFAKAYHVQLRAGSAIVSSTVWEAFEQLRTPSGDRDNPFELVNPVPEPPGQLIVPGQDPQLIEKVPMPILTQN